MEQLGRGDGGSKKNPVGSPAAAKYDDFEKIVNDLISLKMELSSVRDELDESRRKNDEAADSLRTISQLQDELSRVKTAKTMLEKQMAEDAARNPFDLDDNGTTGRSSLNSSNRGPLAGDDPLVTEAREIAKKYYSEMQAAKMQVSSLTAELSAAKIVVKAAPRGGAAPGQGPLSDAERDALVQSLIDTKMQIDSLTAELEDERRRSSELVLRLNDSTTKIASLEARLSNSAGSAIAKPKGIARWGVSSSNSSSSSSSR
jgi:predicted RNase H-like nuclease (RuvC/YqgF family)